MIRMNDTDARFWSPAARAASAPPRSPPSWPPGGGWSPRCGPGAAGRLPAGAIAVEADLTCRGRRRGGGRGGRGRSGGAAAGGGQSGRRVRRGRAGRGHPGRRVRAMLTVNLRPTYLVTAAALPHLVAAGGGCGGLRLVAGRGGAVPGRGRLRDRQGRGAGVRRARSAVEYRKQSVRCNTVLPSVIDTPANRAAMPDADHDRWVRPDEIAAGDPLPGLGRRRRRPAARRSRSTAGPEPAPLATVG